MCTHETNYVVQKKYSRVHSIAAANSFVTKAMLVGYRMYVHKNAIENNVHLKCVIDRITA